MKIDPFIILFAFMGLALVLSIFENRDSMKRRDVCLELGGIRYEAVAPGGQMICWKQDGTRIFMEGE